MRKTLSFVLPFLGLAIFALIVKSTGVDRIIETFRQLHPLRLFLVPAFMIFIIVIRGYRWQYLMKMVGIEYPIMRSMVVWTIGFFAAAITPGKVGDALRAYYVTKETDRNFGEAFLTVFIDRLLDLVVVLIFGAITTIIFSYYYIEIHSLWLVLVGIVGIFVLLLITLRRDLMKMILKPVFNFLFPKKYKEKMTLSFNSFYDALTSYVHLWKGTLFAFFLTVIYWAIVFVLAFYTAYVMSIDVSFAYIFIIMPMVTLVELIPISVSGIGTREAVVIFLFSLVGLPSAKAVGFSVAYLLIGTYLTALVGFFLWLKNPAKFGS